MLKLFRYLKKAYVPVIAIVLLLILQASCDLTLPTFTSNIVNVGIQQKGIEDAVPDVMREETFLALKSLMKQDDADDMEDAYKLYTKDQVKDSKNTDELWAENITVAEAMKKLNKREKTIISKRFFDGRTQMEVAEEIGISQAQVSRLEKSAIERIKKMYK